MAQSCDDQISFYIPARNAERTLLECVQKVREQTRPPDEFFIVVDPRSTDRTFEVAHASGVAVVQQEGASLGAARNTAIRRARHRWLACCDSDVFVEPSWLERLAAARSAGAAGIGGRTLERVRSLCDAWRGMHMPHHWGRYPLRNPFMLVSEVLFDRSTLRAIGGYRDDLNYYEDSDLCQRLRDAGYGLQYEPAAVAHHQRTDTPESLLALRWKYSEYRQRHLLDTFAGLLQKLQINREYALTTLARSLARGRPDLAYLSVLLFFHHAVMDLRSMLTRRPLLDARQRQACASRLGERIVRAAAGLLSGLAARLSEDLKSGCPPDSLDEGPTPPAWDDYLKSIEKGTRAFCAELKAIEPTLCESAAALHEPDGTGRCTFVQPDPQQVSERLAQLPLAPAIDESFCQWLSQIGCDCAQVVGCVLAAEAAMLDRWAGRAPGGSLDRIAIVPHLEARVDPLRAFAEIEAAAQRAVVCYRPPARFIAGLDVPGAADLAEASAAAGWRVEQFDTLVGRIRLLLRRVETRHQRD